MSEHKRPPLRVRMSQPLEQWLAAEGALSSVARGYILIGMAAVGVDMTSFIADIARLQVERIPTAMQRTLAAIGAGVWPSYQAATYSTEDGVSSAPWDRASYGPTAETRISDAETRHRRHEEQAEQPDPADESADPFDLGFSV